MYAFEPQTFADSGFSLRALRVLRGKTCIPLRLRVFALKRPLYCLH